MLDGFTNLIKGMVSLVEKYHTLILEGIWGTLWISTVVVAVSTIVGAIIALGSNSKHKWLRSIIKGYVDFIRGTPILLQLYFFVYGIKPILDTGTSNTPWVLMALIVNSSAYVSEIFRAGINAVDKGQFEAAESLGISKKDMMLKVIFPQAIKNILPALGNEFIMMIKETSLAATFFTPNLMTSEKIMSASGYKKIESMMIIGILYYLITSIFNYFVKKLEKRTGAKAI